MAAGSMVHGDHVEMANGGNGEDTRQMCDELQPLVPRQGAAVGRLCSSRYVVSYMSSLLLAAALCSRVNVSVAITAMVNSTYSTAYESFNSSAETCPARSNETEQNTLDGEFPWNAHTQELILAAFYYGNPILMIPSGLLSDKYPRSCPWLMGLGVLLSSVFSLFVPIAAYSGANAVIVLRFLSGLAESAHFPAVYSLLSRWAPRSDRARLISIVFVGNSFGQITAQPLSGFLSQSVILGGWPFTFYLFGAFGVLSSIAFLIVVYDSPLSHPRISAAERDYIVEDLQLRNKNPTSFPWIAMLTSAPVIAVMLSDFGVYWIFYALTANLPIFFTEVLRFSVSEAGIISSIPHVCLFIFILAGGVIADALLVHTSLSTTAVRKIMTTLGMFPAATFMVLAGYAGCNAPLSITYLTLGIGATGFAYSGSTLTMMEFATPYAGMVTAVTNTFATTSGFVGPMILAEFTENQADLNGWRSFFWISFGMCIFAWAIFMVLGTSELQPWAKLSEDHDCSGDNNHDTEIHPSY